MLLTALALGLVALCSAKSRRSGGGPGARLVAHNDADCYTDSDCARSQHCGDDGRCENNDAICYGDDECRGRQVCDMYSYICVDPTPSPVTTAPPGCCYGDSYKANDKCSKASEQGKCEEKGCRWIETDDASDCELTTSSTPTTTQEAGCCKGDSSKTNSMCNARETRDKCDRSSSCHWIQDGEVHDECAYPPTEPPEDPGCCYGNPDAAYSKCWMEQCTAYFTERECLLLTDDDGNARCAWEPLGEYLDCEMLWPTTTTTTIAPGCCRGSSYKAQAKCYGIDDQIGCERKDCEWVETDDPSDCVITTETPTTTTTTTEEPGCCAGDSSKSTPMCNAREGRERCEKSSSCHFVKDGDVEVDCAWKETEPPEEPGCCYGNPDAAYSKRWMEACTAYYTERECLMLTDDDGNYRCAWQPLGEYMDCEMLWPTTTTTTLPPGCCRGSSYKAQAKCFGIEDQVGCERKDCEWVETEDPNDCVITTTTTTTTTTTEEPGCCKGDSMSSNDKCNSIDNGDKCDARSSCHWIAFGKLEDDCAWKVTDPPEEPGCCYGNPDIAYSKKWMESCTEFYTEKDCTLLTNSDGHARCVWEPLGEYMDCEMLWPTTTTTTIAPGCCRGSSYKAQAKCYGIEDQDGCERKDCEWVETDDPNDCVITTTTTTEETGCCYGEGAKANEMCGNKDSESQCSRSSNCEWRTGEHADCTWTPTTTTSEPWMGAKSDQQSSLLFGESAVVSEAMNTQISLSTLLLVVVAALAGQQLYRWWSTCRDNKLAAPVPPQQGRYQAV